MLWRLPINATKPAAFSATSFNSSSSQQGWQVSFVPVSSALTFLVLIQGIIPFSSLGLLCTLPLALSLFNPSGLSSQCLLPFLPVPSVLLLTSCFCSSFLQTLNTFLWCGIKITPAVQKRNKKILSCSDYVMDHA